jgi:hypothetical protein
MASDDKMGFAASSPTTSDSINYVNNQIVDI